MHTDQVRDAADAVADGLFRALAVLRVVLLLNSVALNIYRADNFQKPVAGAVCVAVMIGWTGVAIWAYAAPRRRGFPLLVADLVVTTALLAVTPLVKGAGFNATVPGFWIAGALLAWAIHYRWAGGLGIGVLFAVVDLSLRDGIRQSDYGHAFLLVIAGLIVGFMSGSLQRMANQREIAERSASAAAERARLARAVHDGVLQVLALVQRRGRELGGESAELGRLAGEQERVLRGLIRQQEAVTESRSDRTVDLAAALSRLERRQSVTVATPGTPVNLPTAMADEVLAVIRACLDNVTMHVGHDASAWVLLQAFSDRIELSVRDEGPGIPVGRIVEAAAQGRLGVAGSIQGRISDLGGTAEITTGPFGTEWEFVVPRPSSSLDATS